MKRFNPEPPVYLTDIYTHLKLYIAVAIHNLKWVKIIYIC